MWKTSDPSHVVQMIPIDAEGNVMLMHRGPHVRSVPNVWSFPSGLHDIGETIAECAARELFEEFNLTGEKCVVLGTYENLPGDGYHWVITVVLVQVESFDRMLNKEPEKHDKTEIVSQHRLLDTDFFDVYNFHPSFAEWAKKAFVGILANVQR